MLTMHKQQCGIAALSTAVLVLSGALPRPGAHAAVTPPAPALAYVANGQVAVIEAGNLTVAGTGQNPLWAPNASSLLFDAPDMMAGNMIISVADQHGANAHVIVSRANPAVNPSWSPDSQYVLYTIAAPGAKAKGPMVTLQVRAMRLATGATKTLGTFTFAGGCSLASSALQAAFAQAQGSYLGAPSTLIWAQPATVVVQSSCTGQGLTLLKVGGAVQTLKGWSGGVLSPDGKSVVAAAGGGKVGVIAVASRSTKVLAPKLSPGSLVWLPNSKQVFTISQPANPATGMVSVVRFSPDGKTTSTLGSVRAAAGFHLSLNHLGDHLVMALVASGSPKVGAPPAVSVVDVPALSPGVPTPIIAGGQPAWRP
jgi:dipeptidyl aminopeptidase/acylaminoacyl peptidase